MNLYLFLTSLLVFADSLCPVLQFLNKLGLLLVVIFKLKQYFMSLVLLND